MYVVEELLFVQKSFTNVHCAPVPSSCTTGTEIPKWKDCIVKQLDCRERGQVRACQKIWPKDLAKIFGQGTCTCEAS